MAEWRVSEIYEPQEGQRKTSRSVKEWAEDDRPREKMMAHGAATLSTAELLAILIGSGTAEESAVDLTKRLLADCGNRLSRLSRMSLRELTAYKGIGAAKAVTIMAACELGRRREKETPQKRTILSDSRKVYDHVWPMMRDLDVEECYLMLMSQGFQLIDTVRLSRGGITDTAVDVRLIMKHAIMANATIIALAHNHPSGNLKPSRNDNALTQSIKDACMTMRITFSDHLIVTDGGYYSYSDEGKL